MSIRAKLRQGQRLVVSRHFNEGFNCCETIGAFILQLLGLEAKSYPKLATPFGGGILQEKAHVRRPFGGGDGGSLKIWPNTPEGKREPSSERVARLVEKFTEKYGSANCIEVLGYDPEDLEKVKRDKDKIRANICGPLIRQVAEWLWDEIK